jgi:eukaryotic-like serine/threonine-protein kinase
MVREGPDFFLASDPCDDAQKSLSVKVETGYMKPASLGPYEILSPLGAGGMGEVYRAKDTRLGRDVAVKILPHKLADDPQALARFETEARAIAALSHPNILAIFDVGQARGIHYAVTELLEGHSLRVALAEGPLPARRALHIASQVAEALATAHENGIVHRDLKPENVFLGADGHVKLLDFGLARHDGSCHGTRDPPSPTITDLPRPGSVAGTVAYMSPEQAKGQPVDYRSDQFSLGIVLYEMLVGLRPFRGGSDPETLTSIIREEPEPLERAAPAVAGPVRWIVERCLEKEPEERYSSTRDLAKELQNLRKHVSETGRATNVAPDDTLRLRRRVPSWALAAVAALAATLGVFGGIRFVRSGSPAAFPLSLSVSFPPDVALLTGDTNPLALTPDGKALVYAGSAGGNGGKLMLFVRRLDRDENRPIPGTEGASYPFTSPDGTQVGFFAEGRLKRVALAGGPPTSLCDASNPRGGSWGPDQTIVFARSRVLGLWSIPASGGEPRRVTTPDAAKGERHYFPEILPDGEHVLFQIGEGNGKSRAAIVSLRTREQRNVMEDAGYPRYLPTGHLLFTRPGSLFAVPFSLKRLETSGPPGLLLDHLLTNWDFTHAAEYAYSHEGTLVYLPYLELQRTLVWVDRKGATERTAFPPGGYHAIALSPDGGRLAAIAYERGEKTALLIGDLARKTLSRSTTEGDFQCLAWTPDGKRLAFGLGRNGAIRTASWQPADESAPPERLTSETAFQMEFPISFSPDGSSLLLTVMSHSDLSSEMWNSFILPLSGQRKPRPFLRTMGRARFSPDGRWVAYESSEAGGYQVIVRPFPGPGPRWQISTDGGNQPLWSRSGRELFFWQGERLMAVDLETKPSFRAGQPRVLFEGNYHRSENFYDVSPDGTRFLVIKPDPAESGPAHVSVVLNWFEDVKKRVPRGKPD